MRQIWSPAWLKAARTVVRGRRSAGVSSELRRSSVETLILLVLIGVIGTLGFQYWNDLSDASEAIGDDAFTIVMCGMLGAASLLAIGCLLGSFLETGRSVARLAVELERRTVDNDRSLHPESGPPTVILLARAINNFLAHESSRIDQHLTLQAECAHDMRGPLTRINLRSEKIEDDEIRLGIERDVAELSALVESTLKLAYSLQGVHEPAEQVDVDRILENIVDDYDGVGQHVELVGRLDNPLLTRPHALRRVLTNLIDNALRYAGNAKLRVKIRSTSVEIAVIDDGPGVASDELAAIFTPWYQSPASGGCRNGCGLGLSIASRLALSIDGELVLQNRMEGGLEATLRLPLGAR